jgi:hypothetical protein
MRAAWLGSQAWYTGEKMIDPHNNPVTSDLEASINLDLC